MNTMAVTILGLIFGIFVALVPVALLVVLQVWLCKRGKWLGLILPMLSLLMSLLLVCSLGVFQTVTGSAGVSIATENGVVIQEQEQDQRQAALTPGAVGAIATLFLVTNIPTVVFGGIWLYYKNRRDFQNDLKKMKLEDLE